jgi:D-arabinose 5-phosphate isomerase GutQ
MASNGLAEAKRVFDIEAACIAEGYQYLDEDQFLRAVTTLAQAQRIAASGAGHSGIACRHFAHLMCCIERPARFIPPSEATHGGLGYVQKGDVMLLASRGGKTKELIPIEDICLKKGATVICVTEDVESPLALNANIVLAMHVTRETDKYNYQGTTSFTAMNVIFDALQASLIEVTGFKNEQFALIHPGGAVGEELNK